MYSLSLLFTVCFAFFFQVPQDLGKLPGSDVPLPTVAVAELSPIFTPGTDGFVIHGGFVMHRATTLSSRELLQKHAAEKLSNRLCSRKRKGEKIIYDILHNGKSIEVATHSGGRIDVTRFETFHRDDIKDLEKQFPNVAKSFELLPIEVVSIQIRVTRTVMHDQQLETMYPELFEIYSQYLNKRE